MPTTLPATPSDTVALTSRISNWLRRTGVEDGDHRATLAVGLADTLAAAVRIAKSLDLMLSADPTDPRGADDALTQAAEIHAWLFGELKDHVLEMEALWEAEIEERLGARAPDEPEE